MSERLEYPGSLHCHTQYSNLRLRDCIIKENELIDYAIELNHEVVAITDHESISNHIKIEKYYKKIKDKNPNFKVIRGNEIYLCRNGLNAQNFIPKQDRYYHFVLLAKDLIGHKQIREISTKAWLRSYMARGMRRVPTYYQDLFDIIGENKGHVIGSTACLGSAIDTQLLIYRDTKNEDLIKKIHLWIKQMNNIFGEGNFFFELQPSNNKDQIYVNKKLIELSKEFNIPYIITTDAHYLKKEDRKIHKAYLNAQNGDREVDDFYTTTYMMGTDELESYFDYLTEEELQIAYKNILKIKNMCEDYSLEKPLKIPQLSWNEPKLKIEEIPKEYYNKISYLSNFVNSSFNGDKILARAVIERIINDKTLQNEETYKAVNDNLEKTWISSEVNKTHWSAYYLNLQKIIDLVWDAGSLVGPGRGSGVGFILLYILGITQINPLRETTKTYSFRFLNPSRVSVLDIDFDSEGTRRQDVLNNFKKHYGENRVSGVATFGTEKSKSAIITAGRGLGIDNDITQYIASLIPSDRGKLRTLDQCMYGDKEEGFLPIKQFVYEMTENYPEIWEVARKIEGLVCRLGSHAGGVIFKDEDFTESISLMRTPKGEIITAFDLHDVEACGDIKYDVLSVEALDKIHNCIDLLCEYGYAEKKPTLKETYENIVGIYNLERNNPEMWKLIWEHKIENLFQMEQQSGIQGIALIKPKSVDELATLNSVIRLMASEKGAELPLNMWVRYRKDKNQWIREMKQYGLSQQEIDWLSNYSDITEGIAESQECLMKLVQEPELGGNDLNFADKCRKGLAKKDGPLFKQCEEEFFKNAKEKKCSDKLVHYVWDVLLKVQRNYSFNKSHTLAYSLIALQEMNLAYKYPIIFWNCACLISDSGGNERNIEEDDIEEIDLIQYDNCVEEFSNEEEIDDDDDDEEDKKQKLTQKKKTNKTSNYGKIASVIGKMKMSGINIAPPDINKSTYTFSPDVENSLIRFGMSGIVKIGEDLVKRIIENRPYNSLNDFISKIKINKPQMVNLIKAGAFDSFGDRIEIMRQYIESVSDIKKRITLQNMKMLIDFNLIPDKYDMEKRVYNFNKYLKKMKIGTQYYGLDNIALNFFDKNFDIDKLFPTNETESGFMIKQTIWDKIYQNYMDKIRPFIKNNNEELLKAVNNKLIEDTWSKYCNGDISKWEMDSVSCYFHKHELIYVDEDNYECVDFFKLSEEPDIDNIITIKNKQIPLFKIRRIMGTVLDKNKMKKTITILTNSGVVNVRIFGDVFTHYDRQISEKDLSGKKHVIEKSWFSRGNKIIITGIRRESDFIAKKYSRTPYHLVELIENINDDGTLEIKHEREKVE